MTPKHQKFVDNYLICGDAQKSARAAGFSHKGAKVVGCRLLKNTEIKEAIEKRKSQDSAKADIRREELIKRLREVAFERKVKVIRGGHLIKALELLGKHLGMFSDKVEQKHEGKIEIEITDYRSKK